MNLAKILVRQDSNLCKNYMFKVLVSNHSYQKSRPDNPEEVYHCLQTDSVLGVA